MAADHVLLNAVDEDPTTAVIRTYEWAEPTLSLGYFQAYAELQKEPRWQGVSVVRRASGGGALWHHHELTYAVVLPRSLPGAHRPSELYRMIHEALADWLREKKVVASRRHLQNETSATSGTAADSRPFLCFLDQDPEDVVVGTTKVIGSAQRRRPQAVLQHGAILHSVSSTTPELPGLVDLGANVGTVHQWIEELPQKLANALGLTLVQDSWSADLHKSIQQAVDMQFGRPEWIQKR